MTIPTEVAEHIAALKKYADETFGAAMVGVIANRLESALTKAQAVAWIDKGGGIAVFGTHAEAWRSLPDGVHELYAHAPPAVPVESLCGDCPPAGYPTEATRCEPCPRRREPPASVPDGCPQGEVSCDDCGGREFGVYNKSAAVLFCHGCGQFTTLKPTNPEGAAP